MKYPKINTIWKRNKENKFAIIEGEHSLEEFKEISKWDVTEKIDGTNIRIMFSDNTIRFGGRTDNAQIPTHLFESLQNTFTLKLMQEVFGTAENLLDVQLFGEGYGPKIQSGGAYRKDAGFILFDVKIGDWWLLRNAVEDIASKLNIPCVPYIGYMNVESIVDYVKARPESIAAEDYKLMEGVVCRTKSMMLSRNGTPIMWKLKVRDYKE